MIFTLLFFFSFPHPTYCSRSSAPHACAVQPQDPAPQGAAARGPWGHGDSVGPAGPRRRGGAPQARVLLVGPVLREPGRVSFSGRLSPLRKCLTPAQAALPRRLSAREAPLASGSPLAAWVQGEAQGGVSCPQIHTWLLGTPLPAALGWEEALAVPVGERRRRVLSAPSLLLPTGSEGAEEARQCVHSSAAAPLHGLGCARRAGGCREGDHGAGGARRAPCCPPGLAPAQGLPPARICTALPGDVQAPCGCASSVQRGFFGVFLGVTAISAREHVSNPKERVSRSTAGAGGAAVACPGLYKCGLSL